ncbi:MAG: hypothetical protein HWD63_15990 [Candidatus Parvibacillus calidus]|nr:MAG: hypothetical protein HWD63_15990 [Candidatus Parvibacillus calidus]
MSVKERRKELSFPMESTAVSPSMEASLYRNPTPRGGSLYTRILILLKPNNIILFKYKMIGISG